MGAGGGWGGGGGAVEADTPRLAVWHPEGLMGRVTAFGKTSIC